MIRGSLNTCSEGGPAMRLRTRTKPSMSGREGRVENADLVSRKDLIAHGASPNSLL